MPLSLSNADLALVQAALGRILAPLDYADSVAWREDVARALRPLFGAEIVQLYLGLPGEPFVYVDGLDEAAARDYVDHYIGGDLVAPILYHRRRDVYTTHGLLAEVGAETMARYQRSETFHDWYRPNRFLYGAGLFVYDPAAPEAAATTDADAGAAPPDEGGEDVPPNFEALRVQLDLGWSTWEPTGTEARRRGLLQLLQPAFAASAAQLARLAAARTDLAALLDGLGQPLSVVGGDGRVLHETPALSALLGADPDAPRLRAALEQAAGGALALATRGGPAEGIAAWAAAPRAVAVASGRYRVEVAGLGGHLAGRPGVVVALVPEVARVPPPAVLADRFGLTPQEARVARLLAERRTNREIAEALSVSPHTARHHVERVLDKLGVRRSDVAGRIGVA